MTFALALIAVVPFLIGIAFGYRLGVDAVKPRLKASAPEEPEPAPVVTTYLPIPTPYFVELTYDAMRGGINVTERTGTRYFVGQPFDWRVLPEYLPRPPHVSAPSDSDLLKVLEAQLLRAGIRHSAIFSDIVTFVKGAGTVKFSDPDLGEVDARAGYRDTALRDPS